MKSTIIVLAAALMFGASNFAMAFTVELDPATPLTGYVSMGEWNIDGDFEDWTTNAQIIDAQVTNGYFEGKDDWNDPQMNLNISALTSPDPRIELATTIETIFEIRIQFATNTPNPRIDFFTIINGTLKTPPLQFAASGGLLPDVPVDGQFHVFRLTLAPGDENYVGNLDGLRFDPLADWLPTGEVFRIDYFRVAQVTNQIIVIRVDPDPLFNYTSIAEWNTDGDFEDWQFNNIGSSNVSGGILSGTALTHDPHFYKIDVASVDLDSNPIAEFRIKQTAAFTSDMELFFGTYDNPGISGARRVVIPAADIPTDGNFHIYQYDMSTHPDWNSDLQAFRVDPYIGAGAAGQIFEIDYIRVGSTKTPTIDPSATYGTYSDKVVVSWAENPQVNKFQVWRSTTNDSGTATTLSPELITNLYEDTTVSLDIGYYYWVKAFITNDWGEFGSSALGLATESTGPDKPVNLSPAAGAQVPSFPVILEASAYYDKDGWPMEAVQWQLDYDTNFSSVKWNSGELLTNLTTIEPPSSVIGTQNYWRVRYKNSIEKWSDWSAHTMFSLNVSRDTNSPYYFYDAFNCPGNGDVNNNFWVSGRQFGTAAPLNYTIFGKSETGSESANPDELLLGLSSAVSPNKSFEESGAFKIEFDVVPHALDNMADWVALNFGKNQQTDLFPISSSGAGLVFFGNGNFQAFDGVALVGNVAAVVPTNEELHIVLTASTEDFENEPVQFSVFANGNPLRASSDNSAYVYNDSSGYDANYISLYSLNAVSTNTSLFDNLKIYKVDNTVSVTNWLSDSDMLPMNPAKTTHAVNINGESVAINGVDFTGTGTNFGGHANGSDILQSNGWQLMGAGGGVIFHNSENVTNLVTDPGSKTLMEYFGYFQNAGGLMLSGLSPYSSNVISLYSYGWGNPGSGRDVYFSSTSGGSITNVDQDTYGRGSGIIVRYGYVADKNGEATIVFSPVGAAGWHLSGFYSEEISSPGPQISVVDKIDFGEVVVGNNTVLPLEVMNLGSGVVSGSITGASAEFSLANSYSATAPASDIINIEFAPASEENYTNVITLSGTGGSANVTLIGRGVPEPLSVIGYLLSVISMLFARRKD